MPEHNIHHLASFLENWTKNDKYFEMLRLMAQLSRLFSESKTPYLDYRLTENLFCRYFKALNDARSCTAYDARIGSVDIGIKTFILNGSDQSTEKIAEFNKLKKELDGLTKMDLAKKIAQFRNERMQFANNQYGVSETQYHIVGRKEGLLRVFNTPYEEVDIDHLHLESDTATSCRFNDEKNEYTFNKSKSVLMKRFTVPHVHFDVEVEIFDEPLMLLEQFFNNQKQGISLAKKMEKGQDFVMLPLYSYTKAKGKYVAEKSGLNQFNAGGRRRNPLEVYIPIPKDVHNHYPNFFPKRDEPFSLLLPNGEHLSAKICQDGGKALMSNPNLALGQWILRDVLKKKEGELVTIDDLNRLGFDSVCVEKLHKKTPDGLEIFKIYFADSEMNYESFIENNRF